MAVGSSNPLSTAPVLGLGTEFLRLYLTRQTCTEDDLERSVKVGQRNLVIEAEANNISHLQVDNNLRSYQAFVSVFYLSNIYSYLHDPPSSQQPLNDCRLCIEYR